MTIGRVRLGAFAAVPALAVTLAGAATLAQTAGPASTVDVQAIGPKVGDTAPDFSLRDQRGDTRSLKALLGPKGAVLVFFRSADW